MATAGATTGGVPGNEKTLLLDWMARQNAVSAASMLSAISATHLVKQRPGFGQTIRPARGSILASTGNSCSRREHKPWIVVMTAPSSVRL